MKLELETEFYLEMQRHKVRVVKKRLTMFLQDLAVANGEILMQESDYEEKAEQVLSQMIMEKDGIKKFNESYEKAYQELIAKEEKSC